MSEYTTSVDRTTSLLDKSLPYKSPWQPTEEDLIKVNIRINPMGFQKITKRKDRLEYYSVITNRHIAENFIDFDEKIRGIIDKVLALLNLLITESHDIPETEAVFSNILEYNNSLWNLRKCREKEFSEVLVLLESCLKYYDTSELTEAKLKILVDIYRELRSTLLRSYPSKSRRDLHKVGFNIFRPLIDARMKLGHAKK